MLRTEQLAKSIFIIIKLFWVVMIKQMLQSGFGSPARDSSWSNIWSGRYEPGQPGPTGPKGTNGIPGTSTNTGATGPTGPSLIDVLRPSIFGEYIYSRGTEWAIGGNQVIIGSNAGELGQEDFAIAIGNNAGSNSQQRAAIAIGINAGFSDQQTASIAIGSNCGLTGQSQFSVAIGAAAARYHQQEFGISVGAFAGFMNQGIQAIAIGNNAGQQFQAAYSIMIGSDSTTSSSSAEYAVAIGHANTLDKNSIAIGNSNALDKNSIAMGNSIRTAGQTGCIVLSSDSSPVSCVASNQLVLSGIKVTNPDPSGSTPSLQKLPFVGGAGTNQWLPIQIGSQVYSIPIFPQ